MPEYCGCGTRTNKIRWAVSATLGLLGAIFCIAWISIYARCWNTLMDDPDAFEHACPGHAYRAMLVLFILCFIGSSIPCYMMCCCTEPPRADNVRDGVGLATAGPVLSPEDGKGVVEVPL